MAGKEGRSFFRPPEPVVGVDEAGRGALAGPVVASAVILDPKQVVAGLSESKQLSPRRREQVLAQLQTDACDLGVGWASPGEIDQLNILQATYRAMERAVAALRSPPQRICIDGAGRPPGLSGAECIIEGDQKMAAIAAASIVAKVTRDHYMIRLAQDFPDYGFERHKGYATALHRHALAHKGPCLVHRHSFAPIREFYSSRAG